MTKNILRVKSAHIDNQKRDKHSKNQSKITFMLKFNHLLTDVLKICFERKIQANIQDVANRNSREKF